MRDRIIISDERNAAARHHVALFSSRLQPVTLQLENARIRIILLYLSLFFVGRRSSLLPRFISVLLAAITIVSVSIVLIACYFLENWHLPCALCLIKSACLALGTKCIPFYTTNRKHSSKDCDRCRTKKSQYFPMYTSFLTSRKLFSQFTKFIERFWNLTEFSMRGGEKGRNFCVNDWRQRKLSRD